MNVLEVSNLCKSFGKKEIIKNVSFNIEEGQIVGFVGPNGAGKTTTLKLITNLIFPDKGTIIIKGYDLLNNREKALMNIAGMIEAPDIYRHLTGKENMDFIRKIRGISQEKLNSIVEYVGLEHRINDPVKKYSLGMKQRLALGMCILSQPKLLILDEPTNGLDPTGTIALRKLIASLAKDLKVAVLFSSHSLSEVHKLSDKVIFIKEGEIVSIKDNDMNKKGQAYKITANDSTTASNILKDNKYVLSLRKEDHNQVHIHIENNKLSHILNLLTKNNVSFFDIEKVESDIETEYVKIFKETN